MTKVIQNAEEAVADIQDGSTLAIGGFGLCGIPENTLAALQRKGVRRLVCISNNAGVDGFGIGLLLENRQVDKMISSYIGENQLFERLFLAGELQVELTPQGTLAEKLRAGGAGIPAFYTATGVGTLIAQDKESRQFDGRTYILEHSLKADFGIVKAWRGDHLGNLVYRGTAQNFNPECATAGRITIAEVEELVEPGALDPAQVHTPGVYVQRIFQGSNYQKRIERRRVRTETINQPRNAESWL